MAKKFIIPNQETDWITSWTVICPNCTSVEEVSYTNRYSTENGFDRLELISTTENCLCLNCGFNLDSK